MMQYFYSHYLVYNHITNKNVLHILKYRLFLTDIKKYIILITNCNFVNICRLLEDIQLKPMAPGDVLSYTVNSELLFCIFITPISSNQSYFCCLEKAFKKMKSQMTNYRYLGIQKDRTNPFLMSRHLLLLKIVFSNFNCEIWICDDVDDRKFNQRRQYNKNIRSNTEVNVRSYPRNKYETVKRKYSTNYIRNTNTYDNVQNNYYDKKHNDKLITSVGQEIITGIFFFNLIH